MLVVVCVVVWFRGLAFCCCCCCCCCLCDAGDPYGCCGRADGKLLTFTMLRLMRWPRPGCGACSCLASCLWLCGGCGARLLARADKPTGWPRRGRSMISELS